MIVSKSEIRPGDIIMFKGNDIGYKLLSPILKLFNPDWDRWGWHLAFTCYKLDDEWRICESIGKGVTVSLLDMSSDFRVYRWFDVAPEPTKIIEFVSKHYGDRYDIAIYFWTALAVIIRHYINHPIPKMLDDNYSCWELVQEFTEYMNKPIISKYDVVLITDIIKVINAKLV